MVSKFIIFAELQEIRPSAIKVSWAGHGRVDVRLRVYVPPSVADITEGEVEILTQLVLERDVPRLNVFGLLVEFAGFDKLSRRGRQMTRGGELRRSGRRRSLGKGE